MADRQDFKSLLKEQKEKKQKEVISIAEATQNYALQIQKDEGFGQQFFKREGISNSAVSVVQNFTNELDGIADASEPYKNIKELLGKYNVLLKELPGSVKKDRFSEKEALYITKVVDPVLRELNSVTGPLLRTRLAFRDFIKQFKPIKIADRLFGNIPIVGGLIKRKIERQEAGEQELRSAERTKQREASREARRGIEDSLATDDIDGTADLIEETPEVRPKGTQKGIEKSSGNISASVGEELAKEKATADKETKGIFEMIAESTYETNENVKKLVGETEEQNDKNGGFFSNMMTGLLPLAALTGLGGILGTAIGGIGAAFTTGLATLGTSLSSAFSKINPFSSKTPTGAKTNVANTGQTEDKLKKNKSNMPMKNKKKGMDIAKKFGKGVVRGAGRVFLPLAAALSIFDAATGVANADELLDKDEGDLTFRDKASAGFAGFLSGLTFGLVDKKKMANRLAGGDDTGVNNLDEGTYDIGNDVQSMPKSVVQGNSLKDQIDADVANIRKKHFEDHPVNTTQNYNVSNVSNNNMAKSEAILPHMSNKNTDKTVIDIQDVF